MIRTILFAAVSLTASLSLADVRSLPSQPAVKMASPNDMYIGCGFDEIASSLGTATTESRLGYNTKYLAELSTGLSKKNVPDVKTVWTWCVKPDLALRVWSACLGSGDSMRCAVYAAPFAPKGKLGKVAHVMTGWAPPTIEDVDSSTKGSPWEGKVLKVKFEAGRGDGYLALYVDNDVVKFTKTEWND